MILNQLNLHDFDFEIISNVILPNAGNCRP